VVWQIAKLLFGMRAQSPWIPFAVSVVVGAAIYLLSIGDEKVKVSQRDKIVGIFIAFLNSMVLFAASVGILGKQQ
jgi:hypothetical protein